MLARALVARGHKVTWFLSNFEHRSKAFRADISSDPRLPGVRIRCLPSRAYGKNISIARIRYEKSFGLAFKAEVANLPEPDCIILAEPSLFFGAPVRKFAQLRNIPLIVDILDLWPELFDIALPKVIRPAGRLLFAPLYARRRALLREAAGVVACTSAYADMARKFTGRPVQTFYLGVDVEEIRRGMEAEALNNLEAFNGLTCVYAGTLGEAYDMACLSEAIADLAREERVRVIVAGNGPARENFSRLSAAHPETLIYLGEVQPDRLGEVYAHAQVGLCTYAAGSTVSMPVKLYDYMAAGLAVVTSLRGEISDVLRDGAGVSYTPGNSASLVRVLHHLAANRQQLESMRQRARSIGQSFDQLHQHNLYAQYVEELVARHFG